jgi:DNA-binding GntR family transcriptional regulator
VRIVAHRKTLVVGLSLEEILELMETRAVLEAHLVRRRGPLLDAATIARLNELCDEMDALSDYGSRWVIKNWEFHRTLYGGGAKTMIDLVERIHIQLERYTRQAGTEERRRAAAAEHRAIIRLIEEHDYAGAGALLLEHVLHTGEAIRGYRAALA